MSSSAFVRIGGQTHKLCTGPAHEVPTYLPATEKYFYRRKTASNGHTVGEFLSRCRLCVNWDKLKQPVKGSEHGWIPLHLAYPIYYETVNRIGLMELARRSGLSQNGIANVMARRNRYVQKASLRKVMLELISIKRKREYSIPPSAKWRNERRAAGGFAQCAGCGIVDVDGAYTDGCSTCWERRHNRNERGTTAPATAAA